MGLKTITLLMFFYGGLCLLLYQEDLALVYNPLVVVLSVFLGHHLVDGLVYVTASVFLLRRRKWARSLALGYSIIPLLQSSVFALFGLLHPVAFRPGNFFVSQPSSMQSGSYELALGIVLVPLVMSCLFLWALTRPQIRVQFEPEAPRE